MARTRREFIEAAVLTSGVAFVGRSKALAMWLFSSKPALLPEGWEFYECEGQILFHVYGIHGSIETRQICWLIQGDKKHGYFSIPIEFTLAEIFATDDAESLDRLCSYKIKEAIKSAEPVPISLDGGELPLPQRA